MGTVAYVCLFDNIAAPWQATAQPVTSLSGSQTYTHDAAIRVPHSEFTVPGLLPYYCALSIRRKPCVLRILVIIHVAMTKHLTRIPVRKG